MEALILRLLEQRGEGKSVCPSEVARAATQGKGEAAWRALMQPVREAAHRLAEEGKIAVTQKGRKVDVMKAKGPVRLRRSC